MRRVASRYRTQRNVRLRRRAPEREQSKDITLGALLTGSVGDVLTRAMGSSPEHASQHLQRVEELYA